MADDLPTLPITRMLALQAEFQRMLGHDLFDMPTKRQVEYFGQNVHALLRELGEAEDETSWKWWAHGEPYFRGPQVRKELVDAWHFFMNLWMMACIADGITTAQDQAELLFAMYGEKQEVNRRRQLEKYDGVAGKCPSCKRDLEDTPPLALPHATLVRCAGCGHEWDAG